MHLTSLRHAEQTGHVESDGAAERYELVSASLGGAQGGQVSLLVVPQDTTYVVRSIGHESAAVVVDGTGELAGGRRVVAGTVFQSGPGSTFELRTDSSPMTLLVVDGSPTSASDTTIRTFEADDVQNRPIHNPDLGFHHMAARMLVAAGQDGGHSLLLALATFAPETGSHALHRHPDAEEIFYVWSGEGVHLTGDGGQYPMAAGDLVYVPTGEPHGFANTGSAPVRALFGYLGADTLEGAGYEVLPAAASSAPRTDK